MCVAKKITGFAKQNDSDLDDRNFNCLHKFNKIIDHQIPFSKTGHPCRYTVLLLSFFFYIFLSCKYFQDVSVLVECGAPSLGNW